MRHTSYLLAAFVLVLASPGALAQALGQYDPEPGAAAPGSTIPPSQQQALMMAQMQMMKTQQKAFEDPIIIAERDKIRIVIEKEMLKKDPSLKSVLKRFHELEIIANKMQAKQKAGEKPDMEKAQTLMKEMSELGPKLEKAQREVMKNPAVKKQTDEFEAKLEAKMLQIDPGFPKAKAMVEKFNPNPNGNR